MAATFRRMPNRRPARNAAGAAVALAPLLALALACLDGAAILAAGQFIGAVAGLR